MPSSRETIAAWQVIPPESVTIAADFRISGTQSGAVMWVTRISPSEKALASSRVRTILTVPLPVPGAAPSPLSSTGPASSGAAAAFCGVPPEDVTGLDCSIQAEPSSSKAHSVSWAEP